MLALVAVVVVVVVMVVVVVVAAAAVVAAVLLLLLLLLDPLQQPLRMLPLPRPYTVPLDWLKRWITTLPWRCAVTMTTQPG